MEEDLQEFEITQVPKLMTKLGCSASSRSADRPGTNSASHWSALNTSATLHATSAASNLALYDQQSNRADVPIKHPDLNLYESSN